MTEERHEGMGISLTIRVGVNSLEAYLKARDKHQDAGPDILTVIPNDRLRGCLSEASTGLCETLLQFQTTLAPGPEVGRLRFVIAGELRSARAAGIAYGDACTPKSRTPEDFTAAAFPLEDWVDLEDALWRRNAALGLKVPEGKSKTVEILVRAECFAVAGGYVRPIFGLSEKKQDMPLLRTFHEPQTPLNWAVGLAMFSLTDEDRVRAGDWQEVRIADLEDRVFCLTERDAPRRGDHRTDILAEVVKLHTTRNWYYEVDAVRVGRAWKKRAVIGSQYAIPELQLVFLDTKTGKRAFPTDAAVRALKVPLEVKGRRVLKPDGKDIPALPKDRWKLEAVRWRWVQSFNDDLLLTPALVEDGRRKGLPKKTVTGKVIRKGYLIKVAGNVFDALQSLRAEGCGSLYACRLLVMLAHNLHKTEAGIAADRVFRMLGISEEYAKRTHKKPEDLVAAAVLRLKQRDIGALLAGSDEYPRTDPNPDRRKGSYYRFVRSPDYTPRTGIASKEDAETVEAAYAEDAAPVAQPPALPGPKADQAVLPGIEEPSAQPIPAGPDIRAAREAAGMNLRDFARAMGGPSFKTWSMIETGQRSTSAGRIPEAVWQRVRDFVAQHGGKGTA